MTEFPFLGDPITLACHTTKAFRSLVAVAWNFQIGHEAAITFHINDSHFDCAHTFD